MTIIGMKELRTNTKEITRRVQAGESFTVVNRSKPIFDIIPSTIHTSTSDARAWAKQAIERYRPALEALAKK